MKIEDEISKEVQGEVNFDPTLVLIILQILITLAKLYFSCPKKDLHQNRLRPSWLQTWRIRAIVKRQLNKNGFSQYNETVFKSIYNRILTMPDSQIDEALIYYHKD